LKVFHQSSFDRWPFEDNSIQAIITSPPYYSLRKYDIPDVIIGGNPEWEGSEIAEKIGLKCEHEWGNNNEFTKEHHGKTAATMLNESKFTSSSSSCIHCSAWRGQYGLENTFQLYIEHTLLWCLEAKRVLRDDGVFFLNLGDSYSGSGGDHKAHHQNNSGFQGKYGILHGAPAMTDKSLPSKCLLDIPFRVSIKLVDEQGWIKRNNIPWYSPNKMPESVTDRFSKKHEMIFMMVKNPKYYFDLEAVKIPSITYETDKRCSALERARMKGYKTKLQYNGKSKRTSEFLASKPMCNPGDVWEIMTQPSPEKHFAMWPEKLVEKMILCSTKVGDTVLDPFTGSGTTLRVADKLNREAVGIDLGYDDIQKRRLSNIQKELII